MKRRYFMQTMLVATAAIGIATPSLANDKVYLIDFVILNEGSDISDRDRYEERIAPMAARTGLSVIKSVNLLQHLNGGIQEAVRLNIWEMESPANMQALMQDAQYQAEIPTRDAIHNMKDLSLYLATETADNGGLGEGMVLVDLVVMNDGYGAAERDAYEAKVAPIAAQYGMELAAAYTIDQKLNGAATDDALRLNLWSVADPAAMQDLNGDPAYQALADERNRLHDFSQLTLFMGQSNN